MSGTLPAPTTGQVSKVAIGSTPATTTKKESSGFGRVVLAVLLLLFLSVGVVFVLFQTVFKPQPTTPSLSPAAPPSGGGPAPGAPPGSTPGSSPGGSPPSSPGSTPGSSPGSPGGSPAPSSSLGTATDFPGTPGRTPVAGPGAMSSTIVSDASGNGDSFNSGHGEYLLTWDGLYALWISQTDDDVYFGTPTIVEVSTKAIVGPLTPIASYPYSQYWSFPVSLMLVNSDGSISGLSPDNGPVWNFASACPAGSQCQAPYTGTMGYASDGTPAFMVTDANDVLVLQIGVH